MRYLLFAFLSAQAIFAQDDADFATMFPSDTMYPTGNMTWSPSNMTNMTNMTWFPTETFSPSNSTMPSDTPTATPTMSQQPSTCPSVSPSLLPSSSPTGSPTSQPTSTPTRSPTISPTNPPPTISPTDPPPTGSPTSSERCGLCDVNGEEPGFRNKVVINLEGTITQCGDMDIILESRFRPPECGGFDGTVEGIDAAYYCGCPSSSDPGICPGICAGGVAPSNPNLNVNGLSCRQWDEWAQAATTANACNQYGRERGLCCSTPTPTPVPTLPPTEFPTPIPTPPPTEASTESPPLDETNVEPATEGDGGRRRSLRTRLTDLWR